ncbi:MAG: CYTH and CHAD domain-containing protein [Sphingopyxis sp.]|nr:CYTH and CHAD domain-containing protein [Sphingopyxis sp.]
MADEIELKLELSPAAADRIGAAGFLAGEARAVRQLSTYFDTGERHVEKAGFSLRIRRSAGKSIQTIKADGASAAGLFVRSEWERPVEDDTPILDHMTPLPAILGDAAAAIGPLFDVKIERRTWMIDDAGASVELVLDRGRIAAGNRSEDVCEIELELKAGDPAGLFRIARQLDAIAPVRLGVLTKAERGYRLPGARATSVKAEPVHLRADSTAAEAFRQIAQSCIRQFRLNEALLVANRDPDALHQARVAVRRMRSAFSIFRPMTGDDGAALRDELRWLASILGAVRDLDVLLVRAPPGALHDRLADAREASYDALLDLLASSRVRSLLLDLAEWLARGHWILDAGSEADGAPPARDFAAAALRRFRRRIKRRGKGLSRLDDAARHEIRKDAKKLRYASEFFGSLFERKRERRRHGRFTAALETLQDRLGALNDLAAAPEVLGRLGLSDDADAADLLAGGTDKRKMLEAAEDAFVDFVDTRKFW